MASFDADEEILEVARVGTPNVLLEVAEGGAVGLDETAPRQTDLAIKDALVTLPRVQQEVLAQSRPWILRLVEQWRLPQTPVIAFK